MDNETYYDSFSDEQLVEELQRERLYIEPAPEDPQPKEPPQEESAEEETAENPIHLSSAQLSALLTDMIDIGGATGLAFFAKTTDKRQFRLDHEESRTIKTSMAAYLKSVDVKMSPKSMFLTTLAIVYAPRMIAAMQIRSETKKLIEKHNTQQASQHDTKHAEAPDKTNG